MEVLDTEEKGTDVNLATFLIIDGYGGDYDRAFVISNDSDLALPIEKVRDSLGLPVTVVNPNLDSKGYTPRELVTAASDTRRLREPAVRDSQFPNTLTDANGTIRKPSTW